MSLFRSFINDELGGFSPAPHTAVSLLSDLITHGRYMHPRARTAYVGLSGWGWKRTLTTGPLAAAYAAHYGEDAITASLSHTQIVAGLESSTGQPLRQMYYLSPATGGIGNVVFICETLAQVHGWDRAAVALWLATLGL